MPDRTEIRVAEYESVSLAIDQLSDTDLDRLRALHSRRRCTITPDRTGWTFTAGATVGVLALDRIRLIITPKVAFTGDSLLRWLCYATATPVPHDATLRNWQTHRHGLPDLVAAALLAECQTLLRDGLRRDYVRHNVIEPVLRGRLDIVAQATKRYGMLDQLHSRTFDRAVNIWENQLCGLALRRARTMVADPQLARQLALTAIEFPTTPTVTSALRTLDRTTYTRLNRRYRTAHLWSGLILRGGGVTDLLVDTGSSAETLLLDMPVLWEAIVRRLVRDAAPVGAELIPATGTSAINVHGDLSPRPPFRPDVLLRHTDNAQTHLLYPIDAKYKTYADRIVSTDDVHQLLTYTAGYTPTSAPLAAIVHPHPSTSSHRTLRISGNSRHLGTVHVHGVDTAASPAQAAIDIGTALFR
ncbi:PE-PGRS family protein [Nocardia cyriacigeorgica]|uniref:PE-PGRS family protein n=1 Tax=Nocardia cyriacigeorgica TaxID=135487 RepID=A0A5R8P539_9NOCA|nr:PE-PGRS family protein [Nocardia cyriacigeorgica]TLF93653.1 PE-PGRS family protein [Nocardia cyriacigeorgica]